MFENVSDAYFQESVRIYDQAAEALESGDLIRAGEQIQSLMQRGFLEAWELAGRLEMRKGDRAAALQVIQQGIAYLTRGVPEAEKSAAYKARARFLVRVGLISELVEYSESGDLPEAEILGVAADEALNLGNRPLCRELAIRAACADHDDDAAFWYIREGDLRKSERARMYKVVVTGFHKLLDKQAALSYDVAGEDLEQALSFIREVEPYLSNLKIAEVKSAEPTELPLGVYWHSIWVSSSSQG